MVTRAENRCARKSDLRDISADLFLKIVEETSSRTEDLKLPAGVLPVMKESQTKFNGIVKVAHLLVLQATFPPCIDLFSIWG